MIKNLKTFFLTFYFVKHMNNSGFFGGNRAAYFCLSGQVSLLMTVMQLMLMELVSTWMEVTTVSLPLKSLWKYFSKS